MRIALLTYSTRPRGGVVHTLALAEALTRAGAEVDVWTLARGGDRAFFRETDPAVGIRAVPFAEIEGELVGPRILRSIQVLGSAFARVRDDYDIVHAQDCISANAALPCIRTIHHLDAFSTPELVRCHDRAVVEPYARITVSAAVAEEVRTGWGLCPTVIANGVDAARFAAAAGEAATADRRRWHDKLGSFVLALGGIEPRKGSIDLLDGFARLARPDLRLVFAGGETLFDYRAYRADFEARVDRLGLDVEVLGVIDDEELPALVASAAVMGFVSVKEGFGLAAMESLAAGVPVVVRDLPVMREVYGSAVSYADDPDSIGRALGRLLDSPPDPSPGRELAFSYSWDDAAARHLDFYARHRQS